MNDNFKDETDMLLKTAEAILNTEKPEKPVTYCPMQAGGYCPMLSSFTKLLERQAS